MPNLLSVPRKRSAQDFLRDFVIQNMGATAQPSGNALLSPGSASVFDQQPQPPQVPNVRSSAPIVPPSMLPFTRLERPRYGGGEIHAVPDIPANPARNNPESQPLLAAGGNGDNGDGGDDSDPTAGLLAQLGLNPDGGPVLPKHNYTFPAAPHPRPLPAAPVYDQGNPLVGAGIASAIGLLLSRGHRAGALSAAGGYLQGHRQGVDKNYGIAVDEYGRNVQQTQVGNAQDRAGYADAMNAVEQQIGVDKAADNLALNNWRVQEAAKRAQQKQTDDQLKAQGAAADRKTTRRASFYRDLSALDAPSQAARLREADASGELAALGITANKNPVTGAYDLPALRKAAPPKPETSRKALLEKDLANQWKMLANPRLNATGAARVNARIRDINGALGTGDGNAPPVLDELTPAQRETIRLNRARLDETRRHNAKGEQAAAARVGIQQQNVNDRQSGVSKEAKAAQRALMKIQADESSDTTRDTTVGLPEKPLRVSPGVNLPAAHPATVQGTRRITNDAYLRNQFPGLKLSGAQGRTAYFTLAPSGRQSQARSVYHSLAGNIGKLTGGDAVFEMPGSRGADGQLVTAPRVRVTFGGGGVGADVKPAVPRLTGPPPPRFQQPREVKVGGRTFRVETIKGNGR